MTTILYLLLIPFSFGSCSLSEIKYDWTYNNQDSWAGTCQTGKKQSPIELCHVSSKQEHFGELKFSSSYREEQKATISNTGTQPTLVIAETNNLLTIQGGNLDGEYAFVAAFFLWPADHPIEGLRYSFTIHFIHHNTKYKNVCKAAEENDAVLALVVSYNITVEDNPNFDPIVECMSEIKSPTNRANLKKPVVLYDLLPSKKQQYFQYEGSRPAPACKENVVFIVFDTPVPLGHAQYKNLTDITGRNGRKLRRVGRDLQERNNRTVYYTTDTQTL